MSEVNSKKNSASYSVPPKVNQFIDDIAAEDTDPLDEDEDEDEDEDSTLSLRGTLLFYI